MKIPVYGGSNPPRPVLYFKKLSQQCNMKEIIKPEFEKLKKIKKQKGIKFKNTRKTIENA